MTTDVRYRPGGDNSVLKLILHGLYKNRCYWCRVPKEYNELEIDHIIPRDASKDRLAEIGQELHLAGPLDVHDPGNLAPICRPCNNEKGAVDYTGHARILVLLRNAMKLAPRVKQNVLRFGATSGLAKALLKAATADLAAQADRELFLMHAPSIAQRLSLLGYDLDEISSYETVEVASASLGAIDFSVELSGSARRAWVILSDVCGATWRDLLDGPVDDILNAVKERALNELEVGDEVSSTTSEVPGVDFVQLDVNHVKFEREGDLFEFVVEGMFEVGMSASVARSDDRGDGLIYLNGEVYAKGTYWIGLVWDSADEDLQVNDFKVEEWSPEVLIYP
ncbi:hypothetical protein [Promicromonospora sp. NPDC050249]|uniref:HNH endonuclease n=1 Tax=Promicromonospora sp. NPDC050249 TaxID=3154743 RepID=UPI0033F4B186